MYIFAATNHVYLFFQEKRVMILYTLTMCQVYSASPLLLIGLGLSPLERYVRTQNVSGKRHDGLTATDRGTPSEQELQVQTETGELLLTLMKLRLNLSEEFLGYLFGIHQSTVSRVFHRWIHVMASRLHPLILWPEREDLRRSLPMCFRTFLKNCVSIIDCFEVFIERPSDLKARAQTWSNYKQHNTIKFLISITPQGSISFMSKAWGGRVTDKHLTEHSGFLDKLLPGDLVLADRGFTIEDSVGLFCAELITPPFTRGKKQLSRKEIESAREISRVRIHVERVIGMLRQKYTILGSTLPVSLVRVEENGKVEDSLIDKIVCLRDADAQLRYELFFACLSYSGGNGRNMGAN
uniref:DDE Tnp4 domain-containing protein n=1 Tax=Dicentrarchus labrax TaxID=13489 RepID=A0A8P4KAN6_DICLA